MTIDPEHPLMEAIRQHPLHIALGLQSVRAAGGEAWIEARVGELTVNAYGRTHSTFLTTFMDMAAFAASLSLLPASRKASTFDAHYSMMNGSKQGDDVHFYATVMKNSNTLKFVNVTATYTDTLLAQALIVQAVL
ncbi:acyl-coenzyme A thioesterase PaaI-like protein [Paraburkholderia sp. BL27I4N3]|uniref:PaaI family thioesterase n=1 Tax=Paraburkholderia sp. BL27I4N3 TaxID=1938805 RepID=UPI000E277735|nr:hypothetical protein [Paraburkholderia sp. BL27I4N3]REE07484.1 acyl-coenzyme A thioesterase PaaI-like protein [Paraburkholderia sp. BL27I4N3]